MLLLILEDLGKEVGVVLPERVEALPAVPLNGLPLLVVDLASERWWEVCFGTLVLLGDLIDDPAVNIRMGISEALHGEVGRCRRRGGGLEVVARDHRQGELSG